MTSIEVNLCDFPWGDNDHGETSLALRRLASLGFAVGARAMPVELRQLRYSVTLLVGANPDQGFVARNHMKATQ